MTAAPETSSPYQPADHVVYERTRETLDLAPWLWWSLMGLIFAVGIMVRLFDLSAPPLDFHPARQMHSALIARGMFAENSAAMPAPQRTMAVKQWRAEGVIEPQVFERITAWTYGLAGRVDLRIPRLYSIFFWLVAAFFVAWLAKDLVGRAGALVAALFFLVWPYGVIASRAFQPEPLMIALSAAALWALVRWERRGTWGWTVAAGLLVGLAVYIKSVAAFFLFPALAVLLITHGGLRGALRNPRGWGLALLAVAPYAIYFVDGFFLRGYLVGQLSERFFPEMWRDPAFYLRWISNLGRMLPFELVLLVILGALLVRRPAYRVMLLAMWLGYFLYGMTLSHHISTHDYYHLPLFPQTALGLAAAAETLFQSLRGPRWLVRAALSVVLVLALAFNAYSARTAIKRSGTAEQAHALEEIGKTLGPGASAVALVDDYGTSLNYYAWINPSVWPTAADIQFQQSNGKSYDFASFFAAQVSSKDFFIITQFDELANQSQLKQLLYARYPLLRQSPDYLIFDLRTHSPAPATP